MVCVIAQYNVAAYNIKTNEVANRGYTPEQLAVMNADTTFKKHESCGIRFTKPFDKLKCEEFFLYKSIHEAYELGILPYKGGLLEQPGWVNDVINIFTSLKREVEFNQVKEMKNVQSKNRNRHSK